MTEKQERFIDEYIIDFNATRAAIAAGYSSKRANSQGVHLLSIPEIQAEVRRRKAEISAGLRISAERVLWEMAALGFSSIFDYVEVIDGELRLKELPPEKQGAVSSIKITKNGTEVKLHDKLKALEFLAKYTGLTDHKAKAFGLSSIYSHSITSSAIRRSPCTTRADRMPTLGEYLPTPFLTSRRRRMWIRPAVVR